MSPDPVPVPFEGGPLDPDDEGTDMSRWGYWVPYDADFDAALQRLRHAVFAAGQYVLPGVVGFGPNSAELDAEWRDQNPDEASEVDDAGEAWDGTIPGSIGELLDVAVDAGGTRTVIDMVAGVTATREFMAVSPLTDAELVALFGTARPTRADIEADPLAILTYRTGWDGAVVVAYTGDEPSWLYFTGSSGES